MLVVLGGCSVVVSVPIFTRTPDKLTNSANVLPGGAVSLAVFLATVSEDLGGCISIESACLCVTSRETQSLSSPKGPLPKPPSSAVMAMVFSSGGARSEKIVPSDPGAIFQ